MRTRPDRIGAKAMRIAATIVLCLLAVPAAAQRKLELLPEPEVKCPFDAPQLLSEIPAEVAWAARRLPVDAGSKPTTVADLLSALRTMSAGETEEHRLAVAHLLHAALVRDMPIPIADLRFEPEGRTRIPWIALQVRAATEDGRAVFELFHRLDQTTDPGWEYVGGSLAIRGHGAFAIELRTHMSPKLRVCASRRPSDDVKVNLTDRPVRKRGFPDLPHFCWDRDKFGIVGWVNPDSAPIPGHWATGTCAIDERRRDLAQLRWLAQLAGERDPVAWAARFDARYPELDLAKFDAFAQKAEQRARDSLAAADAALRQRFKLPERLMLPDLKVVYEDLRREADRKAQPMPERK